MHGFGGGGQGQRMRALEEVRRELGDDGRAIEYPFWRTLFSYVRNYKPQLVLSGIGALLSGIAVALQPMVIKFIVDEGISREGATARQRMIWSLAFVGIYIFLSLVRVSTWVFGYRNLVRALEGFLFSIRSQFFRHVQTLCFRFHDQVSSGELFNYIMGSPIQSLRMFLNQFIMWVPNQVVSWIIVLSALIYFDWLLTCIMLVTIVCIILVNRRSRLIIREMSASFMREESSVSKYVADMLRGSREIKIQAIEDDVSNRFDMHIGRIRDQSQALSIRRNFEHIKPETLQYIGIACVYLAGAYSCVYRDLTVGKLFAFIGSINLMMNPLMTMLELNLVKANAEAGLERIMRILKTEATVHEMEPSVRVDIDEQHRAARGQRIPFAEFRNVTFSYTGAAVLRGLSCTIEHGQSVALAGPSGSGKTTFARLLLRLYEHQSGDILLNGKDIHRYSLQELRASFGVVSQDPFLFQTTLYENIRVARPDATREEVRKAMALAYITEFLRDLPGGENTEVGENGFALSGGQRQRVAIARAILGNPRYYIFDEATSALDNQSERRIQQAMADLGRDHTLVIIAHRLSTIRHVDKILVFEKGTIVQEGRYEELADRPGLFGSLLREGA